MTWDQIHKSSLFVPGQNDNVRAAAPMDDGDELATPSTNNPLA